MTGVPGEALVAACRDGTGGIRAMAALLPLLARSGEVAREDAAMALGCSERDLDELLASLSFRVERDARGRIIGAGLTSIPTQHRFRVYGYDRYVWCALDTLLFPAMLGTNAEVESTCAVSGDPIRFVAAAGRVQGVSPAAPQVILVPPSACCADLRTEFCDEVVFAKDPDHAARYVATRSQAWALPLEQAAVLAATMARAACGRGGADTVRTKGEA
jgi:alkylmercury lyase